MLTLTIINCAAKFVDSDNSDDDDVNDDDEDDDDDVDNGDDVDDKYDDGGHLPTCWYLCRLCW